MEFCKSSSDHEGHRLQPAACQKARAIGGPVKHQQAPHASDKQGQHAGKAVQRALVDLAISEKADQREVAEHGMDKSGFLGMVAERLSKANF